ncbi:hypothetical protein AKJ56_01590 [candidate division MSBL1 archaeon SCGC-AAA382N08]|uniref:Glycosyl transferase n=1 Tax=candidate division MSBL1 archaeon SCGC-AAA382N08 TaxID=1698285 RepID=A0A133VP90_9EURY|nr:hypothetical protein AKJ56_01590 [candidate division MSBL1 archaeon SCGC-AAA382N08]
MVETLKIGMISWESIHSIRVGGLAQAVTGMAEGLVDNGHEVHVFTRSEPNQPDHENINGVHYHRCKFDPYGNIVEHAEKMCRAMSSKVEELEKKENRFDVIHGHDWMVADALEELQDHDTVMSFHSTEYGRNGGEYGRGRTSHKIRGKEWLAGYISDKIITVSEAMKNELQELYEIPPEKISVVPNGSKAQKIEQEVDPGKVKERYGIHPLAPMITFLGRMVYQKGPDIMLDAIPNILDYRWDAEFMMVGDGGMRKYLESKAKQQGISHSTNFPGYVSEKEKLDLLNASDIVCIPSRNEPFGIVLFEAWATGNAVIASNVGGLSENIDNFKDGIKASPHPESIGWSINHVIDDPRFINRLGKNGRKKSKKFTWENIGRKIQQVYKK